MRSSAIRILEAATHVPIIAAALFERTVQIWNWNTGERRCEFDTVTDGPSHLSLSPSGECLVAANWRKGKHGGVACYSARTGEKLWHRLDIRRSGRVRFASNGVSIWCGIRGSPLQQLDALTGKTLASMRAVEEVLDSPYSDHCLVIRRQQIRIKGTKDIIVPKLSFTVLDAAFSRDTLCLTEAGGVVRCIDLVLGLVRWRYVPPQSHHLIFLSYNHVDHCFYGTQWMYGRGGPYMLIRLQEGTGACTEVCRLNAYPDCCCFGDDIVVTSSGDVVSLQNGNTIRRLEFPQCDYPDPPAQTGDAG
jgi:hypothetical protein